MIRRTSIAAAALFFAMLPAACGSDVENKTITPAEKTTFSVRGRVLRDPRTQELVPSNVTMTETVIDHQPAAGRGNDGLFESDIEADGAFHFDNVPPGSYIARLVPAPAGAAPLTITVHQEDVNGIEIRVPLTITVSGRIEVAGNGLIPRFNVICGDAAVTTTTGVSRFTVDAPEGEHRVSIAGLPPGYSVESVTYGTTDVMTETLRIDASEKTREIVVRLAVSSPPPWVRVRGKLTRDGQPTGPPRPTRVTLMGVNVKDQFETSVAANGSFEFPRVLPGKYNARLSPQLTGMETVRLTVENENVDSWEIPIPRPDLRVRVLVEGGGSPPNFQLIFYDVPLSSMDPSIRANRAIPMNEDHMFVTILPAGEYAKILPQGLPPAYTVRSFTDGANDILKRPLKVDGKNPKMLTLTLARKQ